jgi:hypothetical protein
VARRVGNAREVHSGCGAGPCPSAHMGLAAVPASPSCSCREQAAGLDYRPVGSWAGVPSAAGNAAHARRSASSHGCLRLGQLDGLVSVTAAG